MPVKVNGDWKTENNTLVKVDGDWKNAVAVCVKVDGEWKCSRKKSEKYGTIYYKETLDSEETKSVDITTEEEWLSINNPEEFFFPSYPLNIGGVELYGDETSVGNKIVGIDVYDKVDKIENGFMAICYTLKNVHLPDTVDSIGSDFLHGCESFNQPLTLPDTITSIGSYFLFDCSSFNQPLTLPSNLISIDEDFLSDCSSFNQPLTLPDTITSISSHFLANCYALNGPSSTINVGSLSPNIFADNDYFVFAMGSPNNLAYTNGIYIKGDNIDEWLAKFPNSSSRPYRNLVKYTM